MTSEFFHDPIFLLEDYGMARKGWIKRLIGDLSLPDSTTFSELLQSCIESKSLHNGRRLHARLIKTQFASEIFIQNRLIEFYAKCGSLINARRLFDKMPHRNIFTWNAILNALCKSGFLEEATQLFAVTPNPDQCSWNLMVSGCSQHGFFVEAISFFCQMHKENFLLNMYAFSSALSACSGLSDLKMGTQIHASILKSPFATDVYMGSALIDMYSKCGKVFDSQRAFDEMEQRNVVSWNSLITCYEQNGPTYVALKLFVAMLTCGMQPDEVTLASVVSACATLVALKEGLQVHAYVMKSDKFRGDIVLTNAIVDMYVKCCRIKKARLVFNRMPIRNVISATSMICGYARTANVEVARLMFAKMSEKNVVSWNALIAGYVQNGENEEALQLFVELKKEKIWPTHYTFGNILSACAKLANLYLGRQVHTHVLKHGFRFEAGPEPNIFVGNSLVDLYLKCGSINDGLRAFNVMVERDTVSWNTMIMGYAQNGNSKAALELFKRMAMHGEKPDHVTMIGVLCACSHAGLVEEGFRYFHLMTDKYDLEPQKDHYTCMVDLLGRAGKINEAWKFIESMSMEPDCVLWSSLLGSCKVHHDIEMGELVAEKLLELDPSNSSPYVLLSNIYAEVGRWRDVIRVRKLMRHRRVVKQPGCSWVEIKGTIHVFSVKDKSHPQRKEIYGLLKKLNTTLKQDGDVTEGKRTEAGPSARPAEEQARALEYF